MTGQICFGFKSGICLLIAPVPVHCFSNPCIHIIIIRSTFGLQSVIFLQICHKVTTLDRCQNLVFAQYLEKICMHVIIDKV